MVTSYLALACQWILIRDTKRVVYVLYKLTSLWSNAAQMFSIFHLLFSFQVLKQEKSSDMCRSNKLEAHSHNSTHRRQKPYNAIWSRHQDRLILVETFAAEQPCLGRALFTQLIGKLLEKVDQTLSVLPSWSDYCSWRLFTQARTNQIEFKAKLMLRNVTK